MKRNYVALYLMLMAIVFSIHGFYLGLGKNLLSVIHVIIISVAFGGYAFTYNYIKSLELMKDESS